MLPCSHDGSFKLTHAAVGQPGRPATSGRGLELKTAARVPEWNHITETQRLARERAEVQARRVAWQRLLHNRNEYIDWQEFYLWVRSVLEIETPHSGL